MEEYIKKLDEEAKEVIELAKKTAELAGCVYIGTDHIFLGILRGKGVGCQAIKNLDIDIDQLINRVEGIMKKDELDDFDKKEELAGMTPRAEKVLKLAEKYSSKLGQRYIGTGHLLYASLGEEYGFANILLTDKIGVTRDRIRKELTSLLTTGKSTMPSIILNAHGEHF